MVVLREKVLPQWAEWKGTVSSQRVFSKLFVKSIILWQEIRCHVDSPACQLRDKQLLHHQLCDVFKIHEL